MPLGVPLQSRTCLVMLPVESSLRRRRKEIDGELYINSVLSLLKKSHYNIPFAHKYILYFFSIHFNCWFLEVIVDSGAPCFFLLLLNGLNVSCLLSIFDRDWTYRALPRGSCLHISCQTNAVWKSCRNLNSLWVVFLNQPFGVSPSLNPYPRYPWGTSYPDPQIRVSPGFPTDTSAGTYRYWNSVTCLKCKPERFWLSLRCQILVTWLFLHLL